MNKLRKSIIRNTDMGWQFSEGGFTVFVERVPHTAFWNYTISRSLFHPKDFHFDVAQVAYHVHNARYQKRKDAVASALDWIGRQ